jgi:hypothetical protein
MFNISTLSIDDAIRNLDDAQGPVLVYIALNACPHCDRFDDAWPSVQRDANFDALSTCTLRLNRGTDFDRAKTEFQFRTAPALCLVDAQRNRRPFPFASDERTPERILRWIQPHIQTWALDHARNAIRNEQNIVLAFVRPDRADMNAVARRLAAQFEDDLVQVRRVCVPKSLAIDRAFGVVQLPAFLYIDEDYTVHIKQNDGKHESNSLSHDHLIEWIYRLTYYPNSMPVQRRD